MPPVSSKIKPLAMNPRIRRLWVTALRSGKYKQGTGFLRHKTASQRIFRYDSLGVLCDLYAKAHKAGWQTDEDGNSSLLGNEQVLPRKVFMWAGLASGNPTIYIDDGTHRNLQVLTLISMSDTSRLSFRQIANAIAGKVVKLT